MYQRESRSRVAGQQRRRALGRCLPRFSDLSFTVVVFPTDLKQVGDIRQLAGRQIEIEGEVKGYDGRAEIGLKRISQLGGDAKIPPWSRGYDVERHGNYSAAKFHAPKASKQTARKRQSAQVSLEDPSQPLSPTD